MRMYEPKGIPPLPRHSKIDQPPPGMRARMGADSYGVITPYNRKATPPMSQKPGWGTLPMS